MTNAKSIAVAFQEANWLIDHCLDLRHNDCGVLNSRFTASHSLARLLKKRISIVAPGSRMFRIRVGDYHEFKRIQCLDR